MAEQAMAANPYAPKPGLPREQVLQDAKGLSAWPELANLLNAVPSPLLLLNPQRQVVFVNRHVLDLLGLATPDSLYGQRPGEVLDCEHARESGGGCGFSPACIACGAARALASCERGAAAVQECSITQQHGGRALDLRVSATPFDLGGRTFTVLAISDIGHEKRRRALERIFFHDALNTVNAMMGYSQLVGRDGLDDLHELASSIGRLAGTLAEEIHSQRELVAAENNDLEVRPDSLNSLAVLRDVAALYGNHDAAREKPVRVDAAAEDVAFTSDRTLLMRVLGNMVRNALEASGAGQNVTLGCREVGDEVEFWVHNAGAMSREVQLQVFQRSFSTKGAGRGLGTYSIKLLTEQYLRGHAAFSSSAEEGTRFWVRYGREWAAKA